MIDYDAITAAIDHRRTFKIGARGICATFFWSPVFRRWEIQLPRSETTVFASEIGAVGDTEFYVLEMVHDVDLIGEIDLMAYTMLTVRE